MKSKIMSAALVATLLMLLAVFSAGAVGAQEIDCEAIGSAQEPPEVCVGGEVIEHEEPDTTTVDADVDADVDEVAGDELPRTGVDAGMLALGGAAALILGGAGVIAARRSRTDSDAA